MRSRNGSTRGMELGGASRRSVVRFAPRSSARFRPARSCSRSEAAREKTPLARARARGAAHRRVARDGAHRRQKLRSLGLPTPLVASAETLETIGERRARTARWRVLQLRRVELRDRPRPRRPRACAARAARRKVLLVLFGVCPPGEWAVQILRGIFARPCGGHHAVSSWRESADATLRCAITAGATWFAR